MANNSETARLNFERYAYARDHGHTTFCTKANLCREYIYGNQWREEDLAKLRAARRPAITINKMFSTLVTVEGEQLLNRADVSFVPSASGNPQTAEALSKLWLHIAYSNGLMWLEDEVFDSGAITSRGFFDVRMDFDDNLRGEVRFSRPNANNVVLSPDASDYDPKKWPEVTVTKWMTPEQIKRAYPEADTGDLEHRKVSEFELGYDSIDTIRHTFGAGEQSRDADSRRQTLVRVIERQHKEVAFAEHFVNPEAGDMRIIPSNWDRNRIAAVREQYGLEILKRKVQRMRWTVSADDILLFDEPKPYPCFTIVPYFPFLIDGRSIGLCENLLGTQDLLNKSTSQELHIINTTANSGWQMEKGALVNMDEEELQQRGAETGLVIVRNPGSAPLEKIQPNQVPAGIDRLGYKADQFLKELSGVSDSQRGFDRADVAAKAILAKQQAGSINLAKPLSNLVRTRHLLAEVTLGLVQTYYTEERTFNITNPRGGIMAAQEAVTVNGQDPDTGEIVNDLTLGEYQTKITDVPLRDSFEESQFDQAMQLREAGIALPDHVLIESSKLMHKAEIAQEVRAASGADGPSEAQQQMQALEMQLKRLELAKAQAETEERKAEAALKAARAQTEMAKAQGGGEALEQAREFELEKQKMADELMLKREELAAQLQMQREKMEAELQMKREQQSHDQRLARAEAQERIDAERQAAQNTDELGDEETESLFDETEV